MKRFRKQPSKILPTVEEYLKAVKKADREVEQSFRPGWTAKNRIHKSKKVYDRKDKPNFDE